MKDLNYSSRKPDALKRILELPLAEKERLGIVHTPGEIAQQPKTWLETFDIISAQTDKLREFLNDAGLNEDRSRFIVTLIGAGTSDYIGRAIAPLLRRLWRCHVQVVPSTDLITELHDVVGSAPEGSSHLWISFSRSGDSFEGVNVIMDSVARYPEIKHLIVTCNANGQMAGSLQENNSNVYCITLGARTNDQGLAMTSSFTNMVVAGQCLAHIFNLSEYRPTLESIAGSASQILPQLAEAASDLAQQDHSRICFLGSGTLRSVSDESSLKVTELTGGTVGTMSESFLGLRHGPLSWLSQDTLVVGFLSGDAEKRRIELGLLSEIKEKAAAKSILAIAPHSNDSDVAHRTLALDLPNPTDDTYRPPIDIIFAQCLALFASLRHGLKPDTPSADGKIQRVVSTITFA